ncbi:MAG: methyltransferase domain-containing protein [Planctomycetota bacterium]
MQTATQTPPLAPPVRGRTLLCGDVDPGVFPDATPISCQPGAVSAEPDGSVDTIVVVGAWSSAPDPLQTLRAWRRVLKEGGTLVFGRGVPGGEAALSTAFVLSLVTVVGGFECVSDAGKLAADRHAPLVLTRRRLTEIRNPLGSLGPAMAAAALQDRACRAELLFQAGVVLLQAGESELARGCFERMLRLSPGTAEGHFGLGMAMAAAQRWQEALCELECARRLDPDNAEVQRWLETARTHIGGADDVVLPASPPAKWSPAAPAASLATRAIT